MLCLTTLCLLIAAHPCPSEETFQWKFRPTVGFSADVYLRTACRVHDEANKHEWKSIKRSITNWKVKELSSDGKVTFIQKVKKEGFPNPQDGEPSLVDPTPPEDPADRDHDPEEQFSLDALPSPRQSDLEQVTDIPVTRFGMYMGDLACVPPPQHPVKVGEVWDSLVQDPLEESAKLHYRAVVLGHKLIFGIDTLEINQSVDVPRLPGQIQVITSVKPDDKPFYRAEGTFFVDPKSGLVVRGDYKMDHYLMPAIVVGLMLASPGESILVMGSIELHEERILAGQNDVE